MATGGLPGTGAVTQVTSARADIDLTQSQQSSTQQMLDTFWSENTTKINNIDVVS